MPPSLGRSVSEPLVPSSSNRKKHWQRALLKLSAVRALRDAGAGESGGRANLHDDDEELLGPAPESDTEDSYSEEYDDSDSEDKDNDVEDGEIGYGDDYEDSYDEDGEEVDYGDDFEESFDDDEASYQHE